MPLDLDADAPEEIGVDETLEWCFDDDELRRQLRAVHRGRNGLIALVGSGIACLVLMIVTFA